MSVALLLLTGLVLGMRHAFDRDHVAAVTHFISMEPDPGKSAWFGFRWALGHAVAVLALGIVILALHLRFDPVFERWAEIAVGATLILLGLWRLGMLMRERRHTHEHAHAQERHTHEHSHEPGKEHVHALAPMAVGLMHGAAGAAEVFVFVPLALMSKAWLVFSYVGLFSAGCAAAMSLYGYIAGHVYHRAGEAGRRVYGALVIATSLSGIVLGVVWIAKNC